MINTSPYKDLLRISEEILQCLQKGDDEKLMSLLDEKRGAFKNIHRGVDQPPRDTALWIRRVRECEERCNSFARGKKDRIVYGSINFGRHL